MPRLSTLPQGMRARLFAAGRAIAGARCSPLSNPESDEAIRKPLVEPPLMTEADHFLDENGLLLVVEAGE